MLNQKAKQTAYLRALVDGVLLALAFVLAFLIRNYAPLPLIGSRAPISFAAHFWLLAIAVPFYWALSQRVVRRRPVQHGSWIGRVRPVVPPFLYLGLLAGTAIFLFQAKSFSRAVFFLFLLLGFLFVSVERILLRPRSPVGTRGPDRRRRVLIAGHGDEAMALRRKIEEHPEYELRVVGHLAARNQDAPAGGEPTLGRIEDLKRIVEDEVVDEVIFVVPPSELLHCEQQIAWCEEVGVTVHLKLDFVRTLFARTYPTELDGTPMLTFSTTPHDPLGLLLKRGIDVGVSLAMLVLTLPLMILAAVAVRLSSRGPIIFSQERIGLNGRPFRLYKFRSMLVGAEGERGSLESRNEVSGPVFKMMADPRVTGVGRVLRKSSIDELPQLWNVLRGDMSLVGPRPPLASEVRKYERWQRRRLSMKPGITCLWQINGRSHIPFEQWMQLDLEYIDSWSLMLDFKILLRTVPAVVFAHGAR